MHSLILGAYSGIRCPYPIVPSGNFLCKCKNVWQLLATVSHAAPRIDMRVPRGDARDAVYVQLDASCALCQRQCFAFL